MNIFQIFNYTKTLTGYILISLFLIYGCRSEVLKKKSNTFSLSDSKYKIGEMEIAIDKYTPFGREISLSILPGTDTLVLANTVYKSVDFFSIPEARFVSRVKWDPIRYGSFTLAGVLPVNIDSIYVLSRLGLGRSLLINMSGSMVEGQIINHSVAGESDIINTVINSSIPAFMSHNSLYFLSWPLSNPGVDWAYSYEYVYSFTEQKFTNYRISYPPVYDIVSDKHLRLASSLVIRTFDRHRDRILYTYPLYDGIGVMYTDNPEIKFKSIIGNTIHIEPIDEDYGDDSINIAYQTHVVSIFVSDLGNYYARFIAFPNNRIEDKSTADVYQMKYLIQIISQDFEQLSLVDLPVNTYDIYRSFIHKGKLYISTNNYYNPNMNEDILAFDIFDFNDLL